MTTIEAPVTQREARDALGVEPECEAGGSHEWVWVPAGIEERRHFPGVVCDLCGTEPDRDVEPVRVVGVTLCDWASEEEAGW